MFAGIKRFLHEYRGLKTFKTVPREQRKLVFYTESEGYWTYFEPVFNALANKDKTPVLYVTSSITDPFLQQSPAGLQAFYIGDGAVRTMFFAGLEADVLLMTMPDLQTFHIKRSPYPVKYVYLHHSLVSTHMVYRPAAFDHFDTILCAGPHHVEETRAREKCLGLPAKELVEHGYGRLDAILAEGIKGPRQRQPQEPAHVLVAPTWGENGLLELHANELVNNLLNAGLKVTVRPHPRTGQLRPQVIADMRARFDANPYFHFDNQPNARQSLHSADVMISDWSGAALEFAMGLERPVIFVDVPRKVQNPDYQQLECEPLEVKIRGQLGVVIAPDQLQNIAETAQKMASEAEQWQQAACQARQQWVYHVGNSGRMAANYLDSLVHR